MNVIRNPALSNIPNMEVLVVFALVDTFIENDHNVVYSHKSSHSKKWHWSSW